MTREEAINWLKVINTKKFGWDEFALQESQREIRERCEQGVREAIDMAIEALSADAVPFDVQLQSTREVIDRFAEARIKVVRCKDCRHSRVYGKTTQWLACENVMEGQATDPDGYCYLGERREP